MLIWGSKLYGKVDSFVIGRGQIKPHEVYIATKFHHFFFVPLIPTESYFVLHEEELEGWNGIRIRFQWKSAFAGWLRAIAILLLIVVAVKGTTPCLVSGLGPAHGIPLWGWITLFVALFILLGFSYLCPPFGEASESNATNLRMLLVSGTVDKKFEKLQDLARKELDKTAATE